MTPQTMTPTDPDTTSSRTTSPAGDQKATAGSTAPGAATAPGRRSVLPPRLGDAGKEGIPFTRLVRVEMRKLLDTRAGRWMLISIFLLTALAAVAMLVATDKGKSLTPLDVLGMVGIPLQILLPVLGVLTVTSEWSQRTGLVTFALEPRRARVAWAKLLAALVFGVAMTAVGFAISALTLVAAGSLRDASVSWTVGGLALFGFISNQLLVVAMGVGLGLLLRNTPLSVVAYFFLPSLFGMLGAVSWLREPIKWINQGDAIQPFFDNSVNTTQWLQFATSQVLWVVVPLAVGVWLLRRIEIK